MKKTNDTTNLKENTTKKTGLTKPLINVIIIELILYFFYSFLKGNGLIFLSYILLLLLILGAIAILALLVYTIAKAFKKTSTEENN